MLVSNERATLAVLERIGGAQPDGEAWERVTCRRAQRRRRLVTLTTTPLVVATLAVGVVLATRERGHDVVAGPPTSVASTSPSTSRDPAGDAPLAHTLPLPDADSRIEVTAGTLRADTRFTLSYPASIAPDSSNDAPRVCFRWATGATCDPDVWEGATGRVENGRVVWDLPVPGWVTTPAGLRPCADIGCFAVAGSNGGQLFRTGDLDIASGPEPTRAAAIDAIDPDGTIHLVIDGVRADQTWLDHQEDVTRGDLPALPINLCVYSDVSFSCDGLLKLPDLPYDGGRHEIEIAPHRILFTPDGFEDCARVACVVRIQQTVGVTVDPEGILASDVPVASVPYRMPQTAPADPLPSLEFDASQPVRVGQTVTVVLRDPPADPLRLELGQCSEAGLGPLEECGFSGSQWHTRADGALTTDVKIFACGYSSGCYLAVRAGPKGYPSIAHSDRLRFEGG
jgi:hypothetical protein